MRNVKIDEVDRPDREVTALDNGHTQGRILPLHQHCRAQSLYGAIGLMHIVTQDGEWVAPPQYVVRIPPETVYVVRLVGVTTHSLYVESDYVAAFIKHRRYEMISVSLLLCQLLLEAVDLPPLYDSPRDRMLIQLMLLGLATMPVREFDIPPLQHPAPPALRQAFLPGPSTHDPAMYWARALLMGPSIFCRHLPKQLGLSLPIRCQRARVVNALVWLIVGKPVNEVALSPGYDNAFSLVTMFHRVTR